LQFAGDNLVYLLHRGGTLQREPIEVHQYEVASGQDRVVAEYCHVNDGKVRPTQWRGSFSRDGTILAYQEEVLKPVVTLVDTRSGKLITQIRWEGDYTALPVHFHPTQPLVAIPLARWDGNYSYGSQRRLLVANTATGVIIGQYDHEKWINEIRFSDNGLEIVCEPHVGKITFGEPDVVWKSYADAVGPSGHQQFFVSDGLISRGLRQIAGERTEMVLEEGRLRWRLEENYLPVGLRGEMFVSEHYTVRQLAPWMVTLNQKLHETLGCYVLSPVSVQTRYQDARTGSLVYELHHEPRTPDEASSIRIAGEQHLSLVFLRNKELVVKVFELFPFWTTGKLIALAGVITLVYPAWRWRRRSDQARQTHE
jgi:hypothetical protein